VSSEWLFLLRVLCEVVAEEAEKQIRNGYFLCVFASLREEINVQKRRRMRNRWKGKTFLSSDDCAKASATERSRSLALRQRKSVSLWHTRYQVIPVAGGEVPG